MLAAIASAMEERADRKYLVGDIEGRLYLTARGEPTPFISSAAIYTAEEAEAAAAAWNAKGNWTAVVVAGAVWA
jgi:hypothetical protein